MTHSKPLVGEPVANTSFPNVAGGEIAIGAAKDRWTMLFVYRGRHCPRCKKFLGKLNAALPAWLAEMNVVVVSSDTQKSALADPRGKTKTRQASRRPTNCSETRKHRKTLPGKCPEKTQR